MGHTPGPWHCHFCSAVAEQADGEYETATGITNISEAEFAADGRRGDLMAWVPHDRDHVANAHLIAAAPELLAALKRRAERRDAFDDDEWQDVMRLIAKAEGRSE